jgi:uncharacterized NAD(P)/FAD-binding protein YdhS
LKTIAIIGGGFSGLSIFTNLISFANEKFKILIFDKTGNIGKGIAYSTQCEHQLLNVKAENMSLFQDDPNHFVKWLTHKKLFSTNSNINSTFVARSIYGQYCSEMFEEAKKKANEKNIDFFVLKEEVTDCTEINDQIFNITYGVNSSKQIKADLVVIATGNSFDFTPSVLEDLHSEIIKPWKINDYKKFNNYSKLLIVGNGLTMVDTVVSLFKNGFNGEIYTISPNGYKIKQHQLSTFNELDTTIFIQNLAKKNSLLSYLNHINQFKKELKSKNIHPEIIIEIIRPLIPKMWSNLTLLEKELFLKRLKSIWNSMRHRIPNEIFDFLEILKTKQKLYPLKGEIIKIDKYFNKLQCEYKCLDKYNLLDKLDFIIDCTGTSIKNTDGFLIRLSKNLNLELNKLSFAPQIDLNTHQFIDNNSKIKENIYGIGPILKGQLWETTAVREIKQQSILIVKNILKKIHSI